MPFNNFSFFTTTTNNENYALTLYKREKNSAYEYNDVAVLTFYGRPASQKEIKTFRLQQGVNVNDQSIFVYCSNLPNEVKPEDRVLFQGKYWLVKAIGFYFDNTRIIDASCMSDEYIASMCPKGITLG